MYDISNNIETYLIESEFAIIPNWLITYFTDLIFENISPYNTVTYYRCHLFHDWIL